MAYTDEFALFADSTNDLHKKVARAIDKAARDVLNEDPQTANHVKRVQWAERARRTPETVVELAHKWILQVLDNSTVAAAGNTATDNDVQFVVNGMVNQMSDF